MNPSLRRSLRCVAPLALLLSACATSPTISVPEVPVELRPPPDQKVFLEVFASGSQIYECAPKAGQTSAFEWAFRAPEARLTTADRKPFGQHYGGPTWEANDGSKVVAEVAARDPRPNAAAIPLLLLRATSTSGSGVLTPTASIQRLETTGGVAPSLPCDASTAKQMVRVPYTAKYYFYRVYRTSSY